MERPMASSDGCRDRVPVECRPAPCLEFWELWVDAGCPERGHEPSHAGKAADRCGEIIGLAVVPTEPQVARRPVEQGKVRWDGGVIDDRAGTIGALKHTPHGGVEHRPVP